VVESSVGEILGFPALKCGEGVNKMYVVIAYIVRTILENPIYLVFLWFLYLVADHVWGGFAKFLRLLFLPGFLVRVGLRVALIDLFGGHVGISYRHYGLDDERAYLTVYLGKRKHLWILVLFANFALGLGIGYVLVFLALRLRDLFVFIVVSWLAVSFIIASLPSATDLRIFYIAFLSHDPVGVMLLVWGVVVFALSYVSFGMIYGFVITLLYMCFIVFTSFLIREKGSVEEPVIVEDGV